MDYLAVKLVHLSAVTLSMAGFFARGAASLAGASWVRSRAARTLPHVVDTVLFASAIALAWMLQLNPLLTPWLASKLLCVLLYIGLGMVALAPARPRALRATAWVAALLVLAQIVATALTRSPLGLLALA